MIYRYPAGHIWFYLVLSRITNAGKDIRTAQYIFEFLYLTSLLLVFRIYYMSYRVSFGPISHYCLRMELLFQIFLFLQYSSC